MDAGVQKATVISDSGLNQRLAGDMERIEWV